MNCRNRDHNSAENVITHHAGGYNDSFHCNYDLNSCKSYQRKNTSGNFKKTYTAKKFALLIHSMRALFQLFLEFLVTK